MAWTGDMARVHGDVISAQTYVGNAIAVLEGMDEEERPQEALEWLLEVDETLEAVGAEVSKGVSPAVLDLLRGSVLPLEGVR